MNLFRWKGSLQISGYIIAPNTNGIIDDAGKTLYFLPEREYESQCGHLINREDLEHLIYSDKLKVEFHDVGYGIVIQVDNLTGIQQNWKRMYEDYLKERFETNN